jgi:hypothetical protein
MVDFRLINEPLSITERGFFEKCYLCFYLKKIALKALYDVKLPALLNSITLQKSTGK